MGNTETAPLAQNDLKASGPSGIQGMTCSYFMWHVTDGGSHAHLDGSFWLPDFDRLGSAGDGYYFLGDFVLRGGGDNPPGTQMLYKAINDDPNNPCFRAPAGFSNIWSRSHCDLHLWTITPPPGYIGLGCIATRSWDDPSLVLPHYNRLMCVRQDLCSRITVNRANNFIWDDRGSGAQASASVFLLPTSLTGVGVLDYPDSIEVWDIKKS